MLASKQNISKILFIFGVMFLIVSIAIIFLKPNISLLKLILFISFGLISLVISSRLEDVGKIGFYKLVDIAFNNTSGSDIEVYYSENESEIYIKKGKNNMVKVWDENNGFNHEIIKYYKNNESRLNIEVMQKSLNKFEKSIKKFIQKSTKDVEDNFCIKEPSEGRRYYTIDKLLICTGFINTDKKGWNFSHNLRYNKKLVFAALFSEIPYVDVSGIRNNCYEIKDIKKDCFDIEVESEVLEENKNPKIIIRYIAIGFKGFKS